MPGGLLGDPSTYYSTDGRTKNKGQNIDSHGFALLIGKPAIGQYPAARSELGASFDTSEEIEDDDLGSVLRKVTADVPGEEKQVADLKNMSMSVYFGQRG